MCVSTQMNEPKQWGPSTASGPLGLWELQGAPLGPLCAAAAGGWPAAVAEGAAYSGLLQQQVLLGLVRSAATAEATGAAAAGVKRPGPHEATEAAATTNQ